MSAGWGHTCGITTEYLAYCWGLNWRGNLGDGTELDRTTPTPVAGSLRFRQIDAGQNHTCARSYPEDYVYCWGQNDKGQLGDGTTTNRSTPVRVLGSRQFRQVAWATITPAASLQPTRPSVGVGIGVVNWGIARRRVGEPARPW